MEAYETLKEGAARETWEETGARVQVNDLLTMIDVPEANQIHFFFLAELLDWPTPPGIETLEQRLFAPEEIPWDELSFTTVKTTLEHYLFDLPNGQIKLHAYRLSQ